MSDKDQPLKPRKKAKKKSRNARHNSDNYFQPLTTSPNDLGCIFITTMSSGSSTILLYYHHLFLVTLS